MVFLFEIKEICIEVLGAEDDGDLDKFVSGTVTVDAARVVPGTTEAENASRGPTSTDEDPILICSGRLEQDAAT